MVTMKMKPTIIPLAAVVLLVGCGPSEPPQPATETPPSTTELKKEVKEAAAATKDYLAGSKDEFVATMNQKLAEYDARIAELTAKSEGYKDDAKVQADQALASLKEQRGKLHEKFDAFKQASAGTWQDMKAGLATAMNELEKAYENAKAKLN